MQAAQQTELEAMTDMFNKCAQDSYSQPTLLQPVLTRTLLHAV